MAKAKDFRLLLIRSGATEWDASERLTGSADLPLSEAGRKAVQDAVAGLENASLDVVLCGPDEGSVETANLYAKATGAKVRVLDALHEAGLGLWEGLLGSDLLGRCPTAYKQWLEDPSAVTPPEGEALADAAARLTGELVRVLEKQKDEPSVGLVLRPLARGIVRLWLHGQPLSATWDATKAGRDAEWHFLERHQLEPIGGPLGAVV